MATIRATFVLEDRASGTMAKIAAKAEALDRKLEGLDSRLRKTHHSTGELADGWERKMDRMRNATHTAAGGINHDLASVQKRLNLMKMRRSTIHVDADISKAMAKISLAHAAANRNATMGLGGRGGGGGGAVSRGMFGLSGAFSRQQQRRTGVVGRAFGAAASGVNALGNSFDRVGVNLGPLSARLSTLPILLGALAPPLIGAIATALSVLSGAITAVGAAAVGAGGLLGAFVLGIGSIAIPTVIAVKRIQDKEKAISKYKKSLDKANYTLAHTNRLNADGTEVTQSYKNAVDRRNKALGEYNKALSKMSGPEREAVKNYHELTGAWDKLIMKGKSGANAMEMVNGALVFARQQLPTVARWMERFSDAGSRLFKRATSRRNARRLRRGLDQATNEMPARFEEMGQASGHFFMMLLGVLRAAKPLMEWMSKGILAWTVRMDKWTNSPRGQKAMGKFFKDMQPIIKALVGLLGDLGGAMIDLAQKDGDDVLYFLDRLRYYVRELPDFIDKWTDRFRKMWPSIEGGAGSILGFFDSMYYVGKDIMWVLGQIKDLFGAIGEATGMGAIMNKLGNSRRLEGWIAVLSLGALGTRGGRRLTFKAIAAGWRGIGSALGGVARATRGINVKNLSSAVRLFHAAANGGSFKGLGGNLGKLFGGGKQVGKKGAMARSMGGATDLVLGVSDAMQPAIPVYVVNWSMMNTGGGVGGIMGGGRGADLLTKGGKGGGWKSWLGRALGLGGGAKALGKAGLKRSPYLWLAYEFVQGQDSWLAKNVSTPVVNKIIDHNKKLLRKEQRRIERNLKRDSPHGYSVSNTGAIVPNTPALDKADQSDWKWEAPGGAAPDAFVQTKHGAKYEKQFRAAQERLATKFGQSFTDNVLGKLINRMGTKGFLKFISSDAGVRFINHIEKVTKRGMRRGKAQVEIEGDKWVITYDKKLKQMAAKRISTKGFFANLFSQFKGGLSTLGSLVTSAEGVASAFWNKLTGKGSGDKKSSSHGYLDFYGGGSGGGGSKKASKQGDGLGEKVMGFVSDPLGSIGGAIDGLVNRAIGFTAGKGKAGKQSAHGLRTMYKAFKEKLKSMLGFGTGGAASAKGLLPQTASLAKMLAQQFGVKLTSGFRPGAVTEFGNASLHGMGRAIDMGGTSAQMKAVWNYMLGKSGVQELIYNGMASYNGGKPVPFAGADKHTDHVHIGLGDGVGMARTPVKHAKSGAAAVHLEISGDIYINNGQDYDEFLAKLTKDLEVAMNSMSDGAGEMIG